MHKIRPSTGMKLTALMFLVGGLVMAAGPSDSPAPGPVPVLHAAANKSGTLAAVATPPAGGITDPDTVLTPAPLPLPALDTPVVDPVFGTTLRRVTDEVAAGGFGTHIYSQLQAFSPDSAYLLLVEAEGYVVRRIDNLAPLTLDTSPWNAPRWQPNRPHTIVHYDSNEDTTLRVQYTDVATGQTTTAFTFPARYERIRSNQSFDELSRDGRWMAGMATRDDGAPVIFALDLEDLALGAQLALPDLYAGPCAPDPTWGEVEPDWIGVSPLGNYLVVQWARDGTSRCSGLETFDLSTGEFAGRVYEGHQHGDLGVLADGVTEVLMVFETAAPPPDNNFPAIAVRELPGTTTASQPIYVQVTGWFQSHISCQGPDGVCLVTMSADASDGWSPLEGELFLQYMDGAVLRLVHHRSSSCGYWVQPRATLSHDGRGVLFASDWAQESGTDSCGDNDLGRGEAYLIDLGAGGPPATSTPTATPTEESLPGEESWLYLPLLVRETEGDPSPTPMATLPAPTATATHRAPRPSATATPIVPRPSATASPTVMIDPTATAGGGAPFTSRIIDDRIAHGQGLTVVDIDMDGDRDVLAAFSLTDAVYLYLNGGDSDGGGDGGAWATVPIAPAGSIVAMQTTTADFDGDLDVAAVGLFDRDCTFCSPGEVTWYENAGTVQGNWTAHPITRNLWGARALDTTDLTGDGLPDLVVSATEIDGQGNGLYWFRNAGNGASWVGPTVLDATLQQVETALIHDVDRDGVPDVIALDSDNGAVVWYENGRAAGGRSDAPLFTRHTLGTPPQPYDLTLADLDSDPAKELVVTSATGVAWYDAPANPADPWTAHAIDQTFGFGSNANGYAADFDVDGDGDIAIASQQQGELRWYRNDGSGGWVAQTVQPYSGLSNIAGGDLDGDGQPDLVTSTYERLPGVDQITWWQNQLEALRPLLLTIPNGDFERGPELFWEQQSPFSTPLIVNQSPPGLPVSARSGDWFAWLGGAHNLGETPNYQSRMIHANTFTLPAGTPIYLHLYHQIVSEEEPNGFGVCDRDVINLWINNILMRQGQVCRLTNTTGWTLALVDLSLFAGQTITLEFQMRTDFENISHFFLDDLSFHAAP